MKAPPGPATLDTNIAIYAVTSSDKRNRAAAIVGECAFLSVQVLSEFTNVSVRKRRRSWSEVAQNLDVSFVEPWPTFCP